MREAIRLAAHFSEQKAFSGLIEDVISPTRPELGSDEALDGWMLQNATGSGHIVGTCKMGPASDPLAVVDQYCRVHGVEGLRVVDASVMPDVVRANTFATVVMIAEQAAELAQTRHREASAMELRQERYRPYIVFRGHRTKPGDKCSRTSRYFPQNGGNLADIRVLLRQLPAKVRSHAGDVQQG